MADYIHIANRHERAMFNHSNPDMRHWWLWHFLDRVADDAQRAGRSTYFVYDGEENLLAQGTTEGW